MSDLCLSQTLVTLFIFPLAFRKSDSRTKYNEIHGHILPQLLVNNVKLQLLQLNVYNLNGRHVENYYVRSASGQGIRIFLQEYLKHPQSKLFIYSVNC